MIKLSDAQFSVLVLANKASGTSWLYSFSTATVASLMRQELLKLTDDKKLKTTKLGKDITKHFLHKEYLAWKEELHLYTKVRKKLQEENKLKLN